jgi:hypothetical protein
MCVYDVPDDSQHERPQQEIPLLFGISPHEMAGAIRSLDSKLVGIEIDQSAARMLIYTFTVGGKRQAFRLPIGTAPLESIADLYPEAAAREQELQRQYGLAFARSTAG